MSFFSKIMGVVRCMAKKTAWILFASFSSVLVCYLQKLSRCTFSRTFSLRPACKLSSCPDCAYLAGDGLLSVQSTNFSVAFVLEAFASYLQKTAKISIGYSSNSSTACTTCFTQPNGKTRCSFPNNCTDRFHIMQQGVHYFRYVKLCRRTINGPDIITSTGKNGQRNGQSNKRH